MHMGLVNISVASRLVAIATFLKTCYWKYPNSIRISIMYMLIFDFMFFIAWGWLILYHSDLVLNILPG